MSAVAKLRAYASRHLGGEVISAKQVGKMYLPILLDMVLTNLMLMFGSSMVSVVGEEAVAAVNMVDSVNWFFANFYTAVGTGGTVVVAQYVGSKDMKTAGRATSQALTSAIGIAVFLGVLVIAFSTPLMNFLFGDAEPIVFGYGHTYLVCIAASYPFYAAFQACTGALRGSGDTRAAMNFSLFLNAAFLVCSFLLVRVANLGVLGTGLAYIVSRAAVVVWIMLYLLFKKKDMCFTVKGFFTIDFKMQKRIFYIGIPTALEQIFFHGGNIVNQRFVVSLGTAHMAANAVANKLFSVIMSPANAAVTLAVTVVGFCIGAGRPDEAKRLLKSLLVVTTVGQTIFGFVMYPLHPVMSSIFNVSPEVGLMVGKCILLLAIMMPAWPSAWVTPSALRSAGDVKFTSAVALITMWAVRVLTGYIFAILLNMGVLGIWLAMCTEWLVRDVIFLLRIRGEKWYRHKLINN